MNRQALRLRSGQVMILTVLALGGTMLGATAIAGLLMLYQIRQTTDLANSAKAIFAADAGVEWGLYNFLCEDAGHTPCPLPGVPSFANGASVSVVCFDGGEQPLPSCSDPSARSLKSVGQSGTASRAFKASF